MWSSASRARWPWVRSIILQAGAHDTAGCRCSCPRPAPTWRGLARVVGPALLDARGLECRVPLARAPRVQPDGATARRGEQQR
jgi:hypothetical protein